MPCLLPTKGTQLSFERKKMNCTKQKVHEMKREIQLQRLRMSRGTIRPEGHSYAKCPRPPQLWQMMMSVQSLLICPGWLHDLHMMSLNRGGPLGGPLSSSMPPFGHCLATCPEMLQILQTGLLGQSRARWPVLRQLLQAFSLVQSTAICPCL